MHRGGRGRTGFFLTRDNPTYNPPAEGLSCSTGTLFKRFLDGRIKLRIRPTTKKLTENLFSPTRALFLKLKLETCQNGATVTFCQCRKCSVTPVTARTVYVSEFRDVISRCAPRTRYCRGDSKGTIREMQISLATITIAITTAQIVHLMNHTT